MRASARRLYRGNLALGALGLAVLALAGVVAAGSLSLETPPLAALRAACRDVLPSNDPAELLIGGLAALGVVAAFRGAAATARHVRAGRRLLRRLPPGELLEVTGQRVELLADDRPHAFCAGYLRPRIFLSTGALARLPGRELAAVVAHEAYHRDRRDPLRLLFAESLADALFFLPALRRLGNRYRQLSELAADEAAVRAVGGSQPLASALLRVSAHDDTPSVVSLASERVDHLLGERPRWRLGGSPILLSALALSAVVLAGLVAALAGVPGTVNLALLISQSCMVLMTVSALYAFLVPITLVARRRSC